MRVLIDPGFVTREWAVVLKKTQDIKTGSTYALADNFMKFWYTYVYPARSILEINRDATIVRINTTYDQYLGHIFEDIVTQYIIDLNIAGKLPCAFERIGRQ